MPISWCPMPGGFQAGNNNASVTQTTGDCYTQDFTVAAGDIPAGGISFRGARIQTDTPGNTQRGRICLYQGSGDGVPLLTYGDFQQVSADRFAVYTALFTRAVPVVAGTYQVMLCAPFGGASALEFRVKSAPGSVGRLRSVGGTYDPPMDPLSTNGGSTFWLGIEVFAGDTPLAMGGQRVGRRTSW